MVGPVPLTTTPVPFRKKRARHERHTMPNDRRAFRLRFGDGRFSLAPFLRLCACAPLSRSPNSRPEPLKCPPQFLVTRFPAWQTPSMLRIVETMNFPSNGSPSLNFEAMFWLATDKFSNEPHIIVALREAHCYTRHKVSNLPVKC